MENKAKTWGANMRKEKGIELWNKAKKIIPGGTQLLSKRSEQFLPNQIFIR